MTSFKGMRHMKKVWEQTVRYFRPMREQDSNGKTEQDSAEEAAVLPVWRRKQTLAIGGALILLTTAGIVGTQQYNAYVERNTVDIYHVYMNGEKVGTVGNPEEVEKLVALETEELTQANPGKRMVLDTGAITYEDERVFKGVPETDSTLTALEQRFTSHAVGVEVKVDGKVIGVVNDQQTADNILARVQSKYAPELVNEEKELKTVKTLSHKSSGGAAADAAAKEEVQMSQPGVQVTEVSFVEDVAIDEVDIDPAKISSADDIYKLIVEGSTKPTKYVVQAGDCIGCIAQKFDISPQVIYENNSWIEGDRITVGDELDLTVIQPEVTVRTVEKVVEHEAISAPVEIVKNDEMRVGESKTITEGVDGTQSLTYLIEKQNGYVVSEELIDKVVIQEPVTAVVEKGTMVVLGEGTGRFAIPVSGYRITSKFGKRWGRMHNGIDMIGNKTIMAADSGVVEFVGRKQGLGNAIIIDHKNGFKTVYGHLSSFKVSKGDKVEKGDAIGIMGNTGNSTGTHLHFEIHKNGVLQNPLKYL
ncbi:peptidoglycan DD-metalloendopeptidase family protein [Paenibacillus sp. J5C_2022]|uniref:M23 family metallopeptidase n=1 Tax=Paenibacillus sp. J5C2022 TaxID=2977129 RepID=UPI0021CFF3E1|nr:M23 family metallopeptidase [Paenibacillus sp. J5C2022]MCU6711024.1 peptidoglycan DD-metalloendopeptidase family protein [Paenibacillus sp. J5C2022]